MEKLLIVTKIWIDIFCTVLFKRNNEQYSNLFNISIYSNYSNLFSPTDYEKNDKIILKYFQ